FNTSSLDEEIQIEALAATLGVKAMTARQELERKPVGRVLVFVSENTKDKLQQETRDAYEMEEEAKMAPPEIPQVVGEDGNPTPAVGAPIGGGPKQAFNKIVAPSPLGDKNENSKSTYGQ